MIILTFTWLRFNTSLDCPGKHLNCNYFKYEAGEVLLAKHETHDVRSMLHPVWHEQYLRHRKYVADFNGLESYSLAIPASFLMLSKQQNISTWAQRLSYPQRFQIAMIIKDKTVHYRQGKLLLIRRR